MGAHLQVMGDVSFESSLDVSNTLRVLDTTFLNADVSIGAHLQVMGDVSMQSNVDIDGVLKANSFEVVGNLSGSGDMTANKLGIQITTPQYSIDISAVDAIHLPVGTSSDRPTSVTNGLIRYNTTTQQFEGYSTGAWQGLGGIVDIDQDTYITAEETSDEDHLRFYTDNGERMTIDTCGNVGIGINSPDSNYKLDVYGNVHLTGQLVSDSDRRIKDNITPLTNTLDNLDHLRGYSFTRTDLEDKTRKHVGVIAQEVEKLYPELVCENTSSHIKSVNYNGLCAVLIECVKELKQENKDLRERMDHMEKLVHEK